MNDDYGTQDEVEAQRLADALAAVEAGRAPDVSGLEDPELAALIETAALLRASTRDATDTTSFHSYRARSRAFVLHTLEQPAPARTHGILPFARRHRRWTLAAPLAAAAAAAALFLFGVPASAPADGEPRPTLATNQTAATTELELARIQQALAAVAERSAHGQTVDAVLLRTITETTSAVANRIETAPQSVSKEHVATYQRAVAAGNAVLGAAQPTAGSEDALAAAQRATQDGVVAAARFLGAEDTAKPRPAAEASATATATPAATTAPATPTATATPAAGGTNGTVRP